jgi:hypothetical protein
MASERTLLRRAQRGHGRAERRSTGRADHEDAAYVGRAVLIDGPVVPRPCDDCGVTVVLIVRLGFGPRAGARLCSSCLPPPARPA